LIKLDKLLAPGHSDIESLQSINFAREVAKPLNDLFNLCIKNGKMPYECKIAISEAYF